MSEPEQLVHVLPASCRCSAFVRVESVGFGREGGRKMSQERPAGLKDSWLWCGPLAANSFTFGFTGGRRAPELRVRSVSRRKVPMMCRYS